MGQADGEDCVGLRGEELFGHALNLLAGAGLRCRERLGLADRR